MPWRMRNEKKSTVKSIYLAVLDLSLLDNVLLYLVNLSSIRPHLNSRTQTGFDSSMNPLVLWSVQNFHPWEIIDFDCTLFVMFTQFLWGKKRDRNLMSHKIGERLSGCSGHVIFLIGNQGKRLYQLTWGIYGLVNRPVWEPVPGAKNWFEARFSEQKRVYGTFCESFLCWGWH